MLAAGKPWKPVHELQKVNVMEVRSQTRQIVGKLIAAVRMPETTEDKARILEGLSHAIRVHQVCLDSARLEHVLLRRALRVTQRQ